MTEHLPEWAIRIWFELSPKLDLFLIIDNSDYLENRCVVSQLVAEYLELDKLGEFALGNLNDGNIPKIRFFEEEI